METIDTQTLIEKYKDGEPLLSLKTGGEVVGQEVSDDNRLIYIIRDGEIMRVSYAENELPVMKIINTKPHVVTKEFKINI